MIRTPPVTSLLREWARFVIEVGHTPELIVSGVQRIHRDIGWTLDPEVFFFDESLTLKSTGYTQTKIEALKRNYYNPESIERAHADLRWRVDNRKYGSGAFNFRGQPKKGTKQDYCIQACVISYYPQKKGTTIQVFWRTAELIKRFRGDLIFLRDFIFPRFADIFSEAPPFQIDFRFANCTWHPMYSILLLQTVSDWKNHFEQIRRENYKMWKSICYWGWRYVRDKSKSIDSYSSARQVRMIAQKTIEPERLASFCKYLDKSLQKRLDDFPDSVRKHYVKKAP